MVAITVDFTNPDDGDLLIAFIYVDENATVTTISARSDYGTWVEIFQEPRGDQTRASAWWKKYNAGEPTTYTFDLNTNRGWASLGYVVSGADTINPIDVVRVSEGTSSTPTAQTVTTTVNDTLVYMTSIIDLIATTSSSPSGWSILENNQGIFVAQKSQAVAGNPGNVNLSYSSSRNWVAAMFAIKSAPANIPKSGTDTATLAESSSKVEHFTKTAAELSTLSSESASVNVTNPKVGTDTGALTESSSLTQVQSPVQFVQGNLRAVASGTSTTFSWVAPPAQNNLLIAWIFANDNVTVPTVPAGWSVLNARVSDSATPRTAVSYYKIAGAGEPSSMTWEISAATNWHIVVLEYFAPYGWISPILTANPSSMLHDTATVLFTPSVTTPGVGAAETQFVVTMFGQRMASTWSNHLWDSLAMTHRATSNQNGISFSIAQLITYPPSTSVHSGSAVASISGPGATAVAVFNAYNSFQTFNKIASDALSLIESKSITAAVSRTDSGTLSETTTVSVVQARADTAELLETAHRLEAGTTLVTVSENVILSEGASSTAPQSRTDSLTLTETSTRLVERTVSDSATFIDIAVRNVVLFVDKASSDAFTLNETQSGITAASNIYNIPTLIEFEKTMVEAIIEHEETEISIVVVEPVIAQVNRRR